MCASIHVLWKSSCWGIVVYVIARKNRGPRYELFLFTVVKETGVVKLKENRHVDHVSFQKENDSLTVVTADQDSQ